MSAYQFGFGAQNANDTISRYRFTCAPVVYNRCVWGDPRAGALSTCSEAEISLFTIHHKCGVKTSKSVPRLSMNQQEATCYNVDGALRIPWPVTIGFLVEYL